ncbi:MAG: peptidylprolyl isomerase [Candidatus Theseobacter exili]|nr:peptidylprolyl isomerase [Candidatus Theseobacter exili]
MRIPTALVLLLFLPLLVTGAVVDKIVAIVNDDVITSSEVDIMLQPLYAKYKNAYYGDELLKRLKKARMEAIDQLIERKLIAQEAKLEGIEVSQEALEKKMIYIQKRFGSKTAFIEALKKDGISYEEFEGRIKEQLCAKVLVRKVVGQKVAVSPQEVEKHYKDNPDKFTEKEMVQASHILIKKGEEPDKSREKAEETLKRIKEGGNFAVVATEVSEGPNASKGGDLGFFRKGTLLKDIEEKAFSMKPGDVSGIIESPVGFHIIRVEAKRNPRTIPLEETWDDIEDHIFRIKAVGEQSKWVEKLKLKAYIEIFE